MFDISPARLIMAFVFIAALTGQIVFHTKMRGIKPELVVVPVPVSELQVKALSFGDAQFYFRVLAFKVQNMGDSFGRFTPLNEYNMEYLSRWFYLLDSLDRRSDAIANLASHYYSSGANKTNIIHIIQYLRDHAQSTPGTKWRWLLSASQLADTVLKDKDLALKIAFDLKNLPMYAPPWAKIYPAILLTNMDQKEKAYSVIKMIASSMDELSYEDKFFLNYFVKDRLKMADNNEYDVGNLTSEEVVQYEKERRNRIATKNTQELPIVAQSEK